MEDQTIIHGKVTSTLRDDLESLLFMSLIYVQLASLSTLIVLLYWFCSPNHEAKNYILSHPINGMIITVIFFVSNFLLFSARILMSTIPSFFDQKNVPEVISFQVSREKIIIEVNNARRVQLSLNLFRVSKLKKDYLFLQRHRFSLCLAIPLRAFDLADIPILLSHTTKKNRNENMISEEILDDCRIKFDAKTTFLETFEGYLLQLLASFVTYLPWAFIVPLAGTIISFLRTPKAISEALIDHPLAYILTYHNWFLLYFGVWLIFRPVLRAFELALIFLKKSADEQHAKYQINAQVLFYSKKHGVSIKLPWSELKASQKTKRVLVLRFAKLTLTLPFRAVPPEQVPELLSYAVPKR